MSEYRFGHAPEAKPERWNGTFNSKEEAVRDGCSIYEANEAFYVCRGAMADGPSFMPDAKAIEEIIWDNAFIDAGEVADEFPDLSEDSKKELDLLLKFWASRHLKANFWIADNAPYRIEPRTQLATPNRDPLSVSPTKQQIELCRFIAHYDRKNGYLPNRVMVRCTEIELEDAIKAGFVVFMPLYPTGPKVIVGLTDAGRELSKVE